MPVPQKVRLARHPIDLNDDGHLYIETAVTTTETDTDLRLAPNGIGGVAWGTGGSSGPADIDTATTAETDTTLVLAPDGVGGVEWVDAPTFGRWELAVITGSPPDPLYADGDFLYILVP